MATSTLRVTYEAEGVAMVNLLHFVSDTASFDQGVANAIGAEWANFVATTLNDGVTMLAGAEFFNDAFEPTDVLISGNNATAGGSTGDLAPLNCCYVIKLAAGYGRRRTGHLFLPGVDEGKIENGGAIDGTAQSDIVTNFTEFVTNTDTDTGWGLGVRSLADGVVRAATAGNVLPYVGSQRRRLDNLRSQ
jgi:hypothetical protein